MTSANSQFQTYAANMRTITGLTGGNVGTVPDARHVSGYHVSPKRIRAAGRWDTDYSTRQPRDRTTPGSDFTSGFDIGDDWPNGGRAAWLRWNNMLLAGLVGHDPALAAIRAINVSRDGKERKRYDTLTGKLTDSTDNVDIHTHGEVWRDTIGTSGLDTAFRRIEAMARAAISGQSLAGGSTVTDWNSIHDPAWNEPPNGDGQPRTLAQLTWETWDTLHTRCSDTATKFPNSIPAALKRIEQQQQAQAAADATRDAATLAAINALAAAAGGDGGSLDAAPIITAIREAAEDTRAHVEALHADLQAVRAENADLRAKLAAAFADGPKE